MKEFNVNEICNICNAFRELPIYQDGRVYFIPSPLRSEQLHSMWVKVCYENSGILKKESTMLCGEEVIELFSCTPEDFEKYIRTL